jgi:hypothetical protein
MIVMDDVSIAYRGVRIFKNGIGYEEKIRKELG